MRTLNGTAQALQAARLTGAKVPVVRLLYLGLASPQRWAVAGAPLVWGGYTWAARDVALGEVQSEIGDFPALSITLPGVTDAERALAFADVEGAPVEVYRAWVDPTTGAVADALLVWSGALDVPGWQAGAEAMVHFTAESRAALAMQVNAIRYTDDEQRRQHAGDTSLDFDPATDAGPVVWPAAGYFRV